MAVPRKWRSETSILSWANRLWNRSSDKDESEVPQSLAWLKYCEVLSVGKVISNQTKAVHVCLQTQSWEQIQLSGVVFWLVYLELIVASDLSIRWVVAWFDGFIQPSQLRIQVFFVWSSISVEVATLVVILLLDIHECGWALSYSWEAGKSRDCSIGVDVHILDRRWLHCVGILSLVSDFLVEHLQLLLVLLDAQLYAVNQHLRVNNLLTLDKLLFLLCDKASCNRTKFWFLINSNLILLHAWWARWNKWGWLQIQAWCKTMISRMLLTLFINNILLLLIKNTHTWHEGLNIGCLQLSALFVCNLLVSCWKRDCLHWS